jgi:hypothetical protein
MRVVIIPTALACPVTLAIMAVRLAPAVFPATADPVRVLQAILVAQTPGAFVMIFMAPVILIAIDLPGNHATRSSGQAVGIIVVVTREHAGPLGLREDQVLGNSMKRTSHKSAALVMQCELVMA